MTATILIIDDEETARIVISEFLRTKGYEVIGTGTLSEGREIFNKGIADIILLDVRLPDGYGPSLLQDIAKSPHRPQVIIITAHGEVSMAVEAMKNGAQDFIQKPIDLLQLEKSIQRADEIVSMRRELNHLRSSQSAHSEFIVGETSSMKTVMNLAQRAADSSVSVLITGETGTGKEVLANFIHHAGPRSGKSFVDINCPAIQPTMFESELFGHEAGAFTGATHRKNGLMEVADGGILFLDEISSMPLDLQAKLLRAIEERSFRRVGGNTLIKVDVQVIAASNRDLKEMIIKHQFRQDLYYRLKVVDLDLPPLRERTSDIPDLVGHFLKKFNRSLGANIEDVTPQAMGILKKYKWPGNIRELSNVIERAVLFCDDIAIDVHHLPTDLMSAVVLENP